MYVSSQFKNTIRQLSVMGVKIDVSVSACGTGYTAYRYTKARREDRELPYTCEPCKIVVFPAEQSTVSCLDSSTMFDLVSTRINPITTMEHFAPNLSSMPKVDPKVFVAPVITKEPSLLNPAPGHLTVKDTEVNWTRIKSSTQRGRDNLTHSIVFAYIPTKKRTHATDWHCSVQNSAITCKATVKEHSHPPTLGNTEAAQVRAKTRTEAQLHPFIPSSQIVESSLHEHLDPETAEAYGFSLNSE